LQIKGPNPALGQQQASAVAFLRFRYAPISGPYLQRSNTTARARMQISRIAKAFAGDSIVHATGSTLLWKPVLKFNPRLVHAGLRIG
jgi:hypothetical protein